MKVKKRMRVCKRGYFVLSIPRALKSLELLQSHMQEWTENFKIVHRECMQQKHFGYKSFEIDLAFALCNIGYRYFFADFTIKYYKKAFELAKEFVPLEIYIRIKSYKAMGIYYTWKSDKEEASKNYEFCINSIKSLIEFENSNNGFKKIAISYSKIADIYENELKQFEKAIENYEKAISISIKQNDLS